MSTSQHPARPRRRRVLVVGAVVVTLAVAIGVWRFLAPPSTPPEYAGPRPEPVDSGYVSVTHEVLVDAPREEVERWNNDPDRSLEDLIEGDDDFVPVTGTEILRGDWDPTQDRTGDRRRVAFADGHFLAEEVLADSAGRFRYMIWGFTSVQRVAVQHGVAEFVFTPEGDRTRVTWTYSFLPTSALTRPFVSDFLESTMSTMMVGTLEAIRDGVESERV